MCQLFSWCGWQILYLGCVGCCGWVGGHTRHGTGLVLLTSQLTMLDTEDRDTRDIDTTGVVTRWVHADQVLVTGQPVLSLVVGCCDVTLCCAGLCLCVHCVRQTGAEWELAASPEPEDARGGMMLHLLRHNSTHRTTGVMPSNQPGLVWGKSENISQTISRSIIWLSINQQSVLHLLSLVSIYLRLWSVAKQSEISNKGGY